MVFKQGAYSIEEFEQIANLPENRERLLEFISGEIIEKVPTLEHGLIAGNVYGPLWNHVQERGEGRVVMEVRYRASSDKRNSLIPDVSYISADIPLINQGSVPQFPDLAVEVKSPDDTIKGMREKARYYLAHGTRLVWLIYPQERLVEVYSLTDELIVTETGTLDGADVLPEFTLPVRNIFKDQKKNS